MKHNKQPVDYAVAEGLDELYRPDINRAITLEPEKKLTIWPWLLAIGFTVGLVSGYLVKYNESAQTIEHLQIEKNNAREQKQTALAFTKFIKPEVVEAAQAHYQCEQGQQRLRFVCEAVKLESERRQLPIVYTAPYRDTPQAQNLAWKGVGSL